MKKAIIFDLDDTLTPESEYIKSGYRYICEILQVKFAIDKESVFNTLMELFYISPKNVFNRLLDSLKIPYTTEDILELVQAYRNHIPHIRFYDDVLPYLEHLKVKGIMTGIITDGYIQTQKNKLKVLEADKYIDNIILTEELGREYWKPNPKAFELMKTMFGVEFSEIVYVGDNPEKDFYIGNIHPIKTIRILRNGIYNNSVYFKNIKENYIISNLFDITRILD